MIRLCFILRHNSNNTRNFRSWLILVMLLFCLQSLCANCFTTTTKAMNHPLLLHKTKQNQSHVVAFLSSGEDDEEEDEYDVLSEEEEDKTISFSGMEKAWRYIKKPLLRIGSKGAQSSHGNSLRQLLESHQVVKVKVNSRKSETLESSFETLSKLAIDSGAPEGIELLQAREKDNTILFGMPGTLEQIKEGTFPPPSARS